MKCELERITVNYETYGEGQPILMIHGWPVDHQLLVQTFEPIFDRKNGWKRIYIDLPGMGKTPGMEWIKTHDDMLEVVLEFIAKIIKDDHFFIIGQSYGAYLARGVLYRMPNSIDGLIMYVPATIANRENRTLPDHEILHHNPSYVEELIANELEDNLIILADQSDQCLEGLKSIVIPSLMRADYEFLNGINYEKELSIDFEKKAPHFTKPTLIVCGRQDAVVGYRDAWQLIERFPRATFAVLDYAGHGVGGCERDELFRNLVLDWIDRVERQAG